MDKKRIYLSCPTMHGEEQEFIKEAFDTNWVAPLGPNVNAFEKEMAAYTGAGHASALSAGTAAIHLALRILGVGEKDIVFVPSLTFSATCNPVVYEKATPVFIDSERDTWNMSPQALRRAFEKYPSPKAVIVVHLYGTCAKLDEIMEICAQHGVPLVEDAAESLGSIREPLEKSEFILLTEIRLSPHPGAECWYQARRRSPKRQPSLPPRQGIRPDSISTLRLDIIIG